MTATAPAATAAHARPTPNAAPEGGTGSTIVALDAVALSHAIHARELSCAEVLDAYLAQIDRLNPLVNAIVAPAAREALAARPPNATPSWRAATAAARCTVSRRRPGHHAGGRHGHHQGLAGVPRPCAHRRCRGVRAHARRRRALRRPHQLARVRPRRPYLQPHLRRHPQCLRPRPLGRRQQRRRRRGGGAAHAAGGRRLRHDGLAAHAGRLQQRLRPAHLVRLRAARPTEEVFFQQFSVAGPMARNIPDPRCCCRCRPASTHACR